jgi:HD superfamily phosphohydrolase
MQPLTPGKEQISMTRVKKTMYVRDPVHGSIRLSPLQEELLKTVEVQRLSHIHQLGTTYQCYPGAHGMRLVHALGVSHLAGRIGRQVLHLVPGLDDGELEQLIRIVEAAGMLHDIGHTPWSHTLEPLQIELTGSGHMDLVARLVTGEDAMQIRGAGRICGILMDYGIDPRDVAALITSSYEKLPCLQQMIFGEVDADMMDYLQRDFYFTGVAYGHIEVDRLINTMTVSEGRLLFQIKAIDAIRDFLMARFQMYTSVYLHRKTRIVDQMLLRAARRSIVELGEISDFSILTDDELLSFLATGSNDPWVREIAWRIKFRQGLFTQVFSISSDSPSESDSNFLNSLSGLGSSPLEAASQLADLIADEAGVDSGYVIVDLPLEAVRISEERFERIGIEFLTDEGKIVGLDKADPAFADYLVRAQPNRNILTVSCAPESAEQVADACRLHFREAAMPLFHRNKPQD